MLIDVFAGEKQYLDHCLPIWLEILRLAPERAGKVYALPEHHAALALAGAPGDRLASGRPGAHTLAIVAGIGDHHALERPTVFVEHGAGQVYDGMDGSYSGGAGRQRVALFIVPNEVVAGRNRATYPMIPNAVVGCPRLDRWTDGPARTPRRDRAVALSWHWDYRRSVPEARSAYEHYREGLPAAVAELREAGWEVLGHGHPRMIDGIIRDSWEPLGVEVVRDFEEVLARASIYVVDNSSTMFESAAAGIPVVVMNAPWYSPDADYWPRYWACADVGVQIACAAELPAAVYEAAEDRPSQQAARERAIRAVYAYTDGHASERAARAILDLSIGAPMSYSDPYGPSPYPSGTGIPDPEAPMYPPVARLERIGATPEQVHRIMAEWELMDSAQRYAAYGDLENLTDAEARVALLEMAEDGPLLDPSKPPSGTVAQVVAWVGTDSGKAQAALDAEGPSPRKTLILALQPVLDG